MKGDWFLYVVFFLSLALIAIDLENARDQYTHSEVVYSPVGNGPIEGIHEGTHPFDDGK